MNALLEKLADMDELDPQAREWRNQVKDMSYDIEDCIDEFIHHLGNNDAAPGFMKKTARLLKKLRERHQIASKIQEIKIRVKEVSERCMRYKLDEYTMKSSYVHVDPRVVAIYNEAAGLVGIDVPRDEVVKLLMGEEKELKVASIVGLGGLGKTTLANQVYHKLEGKFQCRAFVSVSQKPDIAKLLNKIVLEIGAGSCHTSDLDDLFKTITQHLLDKRYYISCFRQISSGSIKDGIDSLKSLRTLQAFDFSRSTLESFRSLSKLTNLRDLRIDYERFDMDDVTMDAFRLLLESLSHCSSLKSFVISSLVHHFDWLSTLSGFPHHIQRLHLWGLCFPRIPKWIAQLKDLYSLELVVTEVVLKDDSIDVLAGLPSLLHLRLEIKQDGEERIVIPGTDMAFPVLKHLSLVCPKPALVFEAGAMLRLHNVDLWLTVSGWEDVIMWLGPAGIKHLPAGLKKIFLCCRGKHVDEATLSTLRSVFNTHHSGVDLIFR
ncbi:hypothetical protein PR202_ga03769 [Eleusine coracana subsp. coracana]|uniref:Uncharacterized protein n=1 Tax=Eleusine coracana subsp. coracana TaxID=191504 RepID=A0AAV5BQN7_ELECO|nr:hypothetical protein PR202_ga03769 [Eleusine coracana subsp. coracana]